MTLFELTEPLTRELPFPLAELADAPTRVILVSYPVFVRYGSGKGAALSVRWKATVGVAAATETSAAKITGALFEPDRVLWHPHEGQLPDGDNDLAPLDLAHSPALKLKLAFAIGDSANAQIGAPVVTDHGDYPQFGPGPIIPGTVLPDQIFDLPDGTDNVGEGTANSTRPDALDLWPPGSGKPNRFVMVTPRYEKHTPICDFDSGATWLFPSVDNRLGCVRVRETNNSSIEDLDDILVYSGRHRSVCPAVSRFGDRANTQLFVAFQTESGTLLAESQDDGASWTRSELGLQSCRPLACGLDSGGNPFLLVLALGLEEAARSYLPFDVIAVQLGRTGEAATPGEFRDDDVPDSLGDVEIPIPPLGEKPRLPIWQIVSLERAVGVPTAGARPNFAPFQTVDTWVSVDYGQLYPGEYLQELIVFNENRAPLNRARFELGWFGGIWTLVASLGSDIYVSTSRDGINWKNAGVGLPLFEMIGSARDSAGRLHIMARRAYGSSASYRHIRTGDVAAITLELDGDDVGSNWTLTQIERAIGLPILKGDKNVLAYYGGAWTLRAQVNERLMVWRSTDSKLNWSPVREPRDLP